VFEGIRGWWIYGTCGVMLGVTRDGKGGLVARGWLIAVLHDVTC
jgi:hypothetical protein